jgi:WhiB family transcriptional regulator, redox-sensing transcriptional regulator
VEKMWKENGSIGLSNRASPAGSIRRMPWEEGAACGRFDPELFFGTTASDERRAKAICNTCSVRRECLEAALAGPIEFGVWGGLNERERRALRRRHPTTDDWSAVVSELKPTRIA